MEMRRKIEMSNMLKEKKERKKNNNKRKYEKSVCYNER
jgi:hypothetical protein